MKNTIKMSLVAAIAVAGLTSTSSASTLAEAFSASTVKGEIKSQYFAQESATQENSNVLNTGGNLSFKTGSFNGLTAGVTFQTAHVINDNDKTRGYYNSNQDVSGSVMSESYLAYTLENTTAKIGRQYISTPLIAGSGSRILKESFEGYVLVNTDIANTTLVAAYVNKFQARTDGNGGVASFSESKATDGAYTVHAKNTSIDNLTLRAAYAAINNEAANSDKKVIYIDAKYKFNPVTVALQTYQSDNGEATNSDGSQYGIKVSGKVGMVSLMAAYAKISDDGKLVLGLGNAAEQSFAEGNFASGLTAADTTSYRVAIGTKINDIKLDLGHADWDAKGKDGTETNLTVGYAVNKEASVKVRHSVFGDAYSEGANGIDSRTRVYLSYKF